MVEEIIEGRDTFDEVTPSEDEERRRVAEIANQFYGERYARLGEIDVPPWFIDKKRQERIDDGKAFDPILPFEAHKGSDRDRLVAKLEVIARDPDLNRALGAYLEQHILPGMVGSRTLDQTQADRIHAAGLETSKKIADQKLTSGAARATAVYVAGDKGPNSTI